ncbi:NAD-dependent epimerase/dehydratase family protein [Candidatus Pacearchaeota archaeon]|nr:NAD-dependent epimerase/dehydratase family protein [Candidatus Pacearchaeota archaeon]
MKNQKILITGSEGLIGTLLQENLRSESHTIYRCDKKFSYPFDLLTDNFSDYFKDFEVDTVIHLAGYAGPKISREEMNENTEITARVAYTARKNNVKRIIFSSSIHVYDFSNMYERKEKINPETPVKVHSNPDYYKDDAERKVSNYSKSKITSEVILRCYHHDMHILNLRLGAVNRDNQPAKNPWGNATFLKHQDLCRIVTKGLSFEGCDNLVCVSENNEDFIDRTKLEEFLQ